MSLATMRCLATAGFAFASFEFLREGGGAGGVWWPDCTDNVRNAQAAGLATGVYTYPDRFMDAKTQASQLVANLTAVGPALGGKDREGLSGYI